MNPKLLPLLFLVTGCDAGAGGPIGACTEIGCSDQIAIQFVDENGFPVTDLVATITAGDEVIEVDCAADPAGDGNVDCGDALVYVQSAPETLSVTATSGEGDFQGDLTPDYDVNYPNGVDCPPECSQAIEIVTVSS